MAPNAEVRGGQRLHVGLRLTLLARDPQGLSGEADDAERVRTWGRLRDLALEALPGEGWALRAEPFDRSWHLRRGGGWEPEIQFAAVLEPAGPPPPDPAAAERRLGLDLRHSFERLGVPEAR